MKLLFLIFAIISFVLLCAYTQDPTVPKFKYVITGFFMLFFAVRALSKDERL